MDPLDPLVADISRALAVEPSPEFLARIRTRIASEPAPSRRVPWMIAAPALVAMTLLVVVAIGWRAPSPSQVVLSSRVQVGEVGTLPGAAPAGVHQLRDAAMRIEPPIAPNAERRMREPEVLIAADEAKALRQLILGVRSGQIRLPATLATAPPGDEIAIEPITIEPIPPLRDDQGARP